MAIGQDGLHGLQRAVLRGTPCTIGHAEKLGPERVEPLANRLQFGRTFGCLGRKKFKADRKSCVRIQASLPLSCVA